MLKCINQMSKHSDGLLTGLQAREALQSYTLVQSLRSLALQRAFFDEVFTLNIEFHLDNLAAVDAAVETFFPRYEALCELAVKRERSTETVTHWELIEIIHITDHDSSKPRRELEEHIRAQRGLEVLDAMAPVLLDLAASTWLMMSIGDYPGFFSHDEPIPWPNEDSLSAGVVHKRFSREYQPNDIVKLPQTFTAAELEQIGGMEVRWTDNLTEHLLLKDDDSKVMLFHPVSVLELHARSQHVSTLPPELVNETIRTIALLVPPVLGESNRWFQAQQRRHKIDPAAGLCDRLNSSQRRIDRFDYWRDRLVVLKRTFDEAEPSTLSQLWYDDRKKTQWFTFWVAVLVFILTVFFGVIQSVAGIVQAWASVKALKE